MIKTDTIVNDLESLCYQCVDIAREAGEQILSVYQTDFDIKHKTDRTPLTLADMKANQLICEKLRVLTPGIPVLSEELEKPPFQQRQLWQRYWLIDPLDGTREFINRNGEFTVNIALIQNHKSILGVIHVPVTNTDYYAWHKGGSYRIFQRGDMKKISTRQRLPEENNTLLIAGSRSHASQRMDLYLKNLEQAGFDTRIICMGSSLKFCLLAEGKVDLYPRLGYTAEWDTAAAHCIVEQAGGSVCKADMTPLNYNTKDSLRNPYFFAFADRHINWQQYL